MGSPARGRSMGLSNRDRHCRLDSPRAPKAGDLCFGIRYSIQEYEEWE